MLSVPTLLAIAAVVNAQSLTTFTFTINGEETAVGVPAPQAPTTTVYTTVPSVTITETTAFGPSIATQTIIVTAPIDQISSIANEIPSSYQVPTESLNIIPAAVVPVTLNGFTTAINLPSSAS
ncbi:MAG: hypothetical protein Q9193_006992, partial [Seirophora villosa]